MNFYGLTAYPSRLVGFSDPYTTTEYDDGYSKDPTVSHYVGGYLHRKDGPAVCHSWDMSQEWWLDGHYMAEYRPTINALWLGKVADQIPSDMLAAMKDQYPGATIFEPAPDNEYDPP